jgi:hypothetical protein
MMTVFSNVSLIKFETIGLFSLTRHECVVLSYITTPPPPCSYCIYFRNSSCTRKDRHRYHHVRSLSCLSSLINVESLVEFYEIWCEHQATSGHSSIVRF